MIHSIRYQDESILSASLSYDGDLLAIAGEYAAEFIIKIYSTKTWEIIS